MAHNQASSESSKTYQADVCASFYNEKNKQCEEFISALSQCENHLTHMSERRKVLARLSDEESTVSNTFALYIVTWKDGVRTICADKDIFFAVKEINQQVTPLCERLEQFKEKLRFAEATANNVQDKIKDQVMLLENQLKLTANATNMKQLKSIAAPNFDWTDKLPEPEIETLADEWDQMELQSLILHFLHKLQLWTSCSNDKKSNRRRRKIYRH